MAGVACSYNVKAADGEMFSGRYSAYESAVRASAATEFHCSATAIDLRDASSTTRDGPWEFVATGCGWQGTFRVQVTPGFNNLEVIKILTVPPAPSTAPSG
jgi:hypothetical protein